MSRVFDLDLAFVGAGVIVSFTRPRIVLPSGVAMRLANVRSPCSLRVRCRALSVTAPLVAGSKPVMN